MTTLHVFHVKSTSFVEVNRSISLSLQKKEKVVLCSSINPNPS